MKKIMKKVLSLALVLALAIAPATVMAAEGDPVATPPYTNCIYSGDQVVVEAGATTYFEVGTNNTPGTYDFVVEGTGSFDVAVCTEGTTEAYAEGTPISAVEGRVETTITSYESTYGYAAFSITNNTDAVANYTCTVVFPEGTQGNPKALTLAVGSSAQVTVPANTQYYVAVTLPQMYTEYQLTITGNTGFGYSGGYGMPNWDTNGTYSTTIAAYFGPASFAIVNNTAIEQTYTVALADVPKPLGSELNPDALPMDTTTTKVLEGNEYWYTWTATEAGTLTITLDNAQCANGWTYKAICGEQTKNFSTGWDESDKNVCEFTVVAGDVVTYGVSVPTYYEGIGYDVYTLANGTVVFTTAFVAGEGNPDGGDGGSGDGGSGSGGATVTGTEINANYYFSYQELTTGANEIMAEFGYPTTLYTFVPAEVGEYKVTINDQSALLGYYGSNEWYPFDYTESKTFELTLNAEEANAPKLIGVSNALNASITIEKIGDVQEEEEVEWTIYENEATLDEFTFEGNADELSFVNIEDATEDKAVLGDDGYYHLNSANGPILYVDLDDNTYMDLVAAMGYGQLKDIIYDNGEVESKVDYNDAFAEYLAVADADTGLYPLTEDLISIYKNVGRTQGWYVDGGWVGSTPDAWMFACYYVEGTTTGGATTGGTTTGGTTTGGATSGSTTNSDSPKTGDNANVAVWAIVMVVAAGAAFVVAESKRRAR